jgi:hypothetical protein
MAELRHTMGLMPDSWSNFFATMGGAAAALTGLLFIAVSLRPRDIRGSSLMLGRARSAFYSFAGITLVALLALAGTASRWIGIAQFGVGVGVIVVSLPFTAAARREGLFELSQGHRLSRWPSLRRRRRPAARLRWQCA